jgi:hypothetical protein
LLRRLLVLILASLLCLMSLCLLLLLFGPTRCLRRLTLVSSFPIFLASFFPAAASALRVGNIGHPDEHRQRKHSRGCEASIINFH